MEKNITDEIIDGVKEATVEERALVLEEGNIKYTTFDRNDWSNFSGSEDFKGEEPIIASLSGSDISIDNVNEVSIVMDANGISIDWFDTNDEQASFTMEFKNFPLTKKEALERLKKIGLKTPLTLKQLSSFKKAV